MSPGNLLIDSASTDRKTKYNSIKNIRHIRTIRLRRSTVSSMNQMSTKIAHRVYRPSLDFTTLAYKRMMDAYPCY